jgi:hypothetical protein
MNSTPFEEGVKKNGDRQTAPLNPSSGPPLRASHSQRFQFRSPEGVARLERTRPGPGRSYRELQADAQAELDAAGVSVAELVLGHSWPVADGEPISGPPRSTRTAEELAAIGADLHRELRDALPSTVYDVWLTRLQVVAVTDDRLFLGAPEPYARHIANRFRPVLATAARAVAPGLAVDVVACETGTEGRP